MIVQLKSAGYLENTAHESDTEMSIDRPAMLVYEGKFQSMDGEVEVNSDHIQMLSDNYNSMLSKAKRLAKGTVPIKNMPPIQLDHSTSARDTVGRLAGEIYIGAYTKEDGSTVKALYAKKMRFLGKENVEKVKDGRWVDLSIGADLESGQLSEVSVTPFPAAPGSKMLKRGNLSMDLNKMKKHLMEKEKLSDKDADEKLSKMTDDEKKELAVKCSNAEDAPDSATKAKMSNAEDAPDSAKKLAEKEEEEKKKLAAEEEEKKKLAEEEGDEDKLAGDKDEDEELSNAEDAPDSAKKMSKNMAKIKKLASDFRKKSAEVTLAAKKAKLMVRLSNLKSAAKVTPAEVKKLDLTKLASKSDEAIEAVFESYESREPVIIPGVFGSVKAENLAELSAEADKVRLEAETRKNMSLKKGQDASETDSSAMSVRLSSDLKPVYRLDYEGICRLMDDGKLKEAKVALQKLIQGGNIADKSEQSSLEQLSRLAEEHKTLHNQFEQVIKLIGV